MLRRLKESLKQVVYRAMRPGMRDVDARLELIEDRVEALSARVRDVTWRGSLSDRGVGGPPADLDAIASLMTKYRSELAFWADLINDEEKATREIGSPFHPAAVYWSSMKRRELLAALNFDCEADLDDWASQRTVVEVGSGPHPFVSDMHWARAVAVDPLMDGYARENLLPPEDNRTVFIASTGESIPLASGMADVVVMENCIDHVQDPDAVVSEASRLLNDDGLLWLLVDLSEHVDHMHPHAFDIDKVRALVRRFGFHVHHEQVRDHSSHPEAYGECRMLVGRAAPVVDVVVKSESSKLKAQNSDSD